MRQPFLFFAGLLIVGSIVFPTALTELKFAILMPLLFCCVYLIVKERIHFSKPAIFFLVVYPLLGLIWSMYGLIVGNPGAIAVLSVMFVYPLIFPIIAFCYKCEYESSIYGVLRMAAWILVIMNIAYLIGSSFYDGGLAVDAMQGVFGENAVVDDADDYFKFTLPNVSSLIFLIPFFLAGTLFGYSRRTLSDGILILLVLGIGILSGRRALLVTMALGPMLAYLLTVGCARLKEVRHKRRMVSRFMVICFSCLMIAWLLFGFDRSDFYRDQLTSVFDFTENASNTERRLQYSALIKGWEGSPMLGAGAGAAATYSRSAEQPWAYELSYVAFLFQYGLIGFLLYSFGILFIVFRLRKFVMVAGRASIFYCLLAGLISFLIANSTNPYLAKFDYMWVIFLPFAIVSIPLKGRAIWDESK